MIDGLKQILSSIINIAMNPDTVSEYFINIIKGLYQIIRSIFSDGKIDQIDLNNLYAAIKIILNT
jgi:hypothetical protein